jgi:predicted lysophospholipase L1 biosynthesis ABC-type transport system permease subunit
VIIVNETFARRFFRGLSPLGRKVNLYGGTATVVGLVKDSKYHIPMEAPLPYFYLPFQQWFAPGLNFSVLVKTAGDPMRMNTILRREALALNQDAVFTTRLYSDAATASLYPQKVAASLLGVVGIVCLLLAAIGIYSVMSYAVSQRTQELGIRMALGARPSQVLGLVVREGLALALPGLVVGVAASVIAARPLGGMLVRVSAADPSTFAATASFLLLVAVVASYLPAFRATRLDPVRALRGE